MAPVVRAPPYRKLLTPALHKRFTGAAVGVLVICYLESVLIGEKKSWLWSWFPVGQAGIRTLLLFICPISVFVLRVAQLRLGARETVSPFATFTRYLLRLDAAQTVLWYAFSAWWFGEVYVWSVGDSADLNWISRGKSWEAKHLNERSIYLRSVFLIFALLQAFVHIYYDYDSVPLSLAKPPKVETIVEGSIPLTKQLQSQLMKEIDPLRRLVYFDNQHIVSSILRNVVLRTFAVSFLSPFLYGIFIRRTAWDWSLAVAALIWDVPATRLSYIPPHYPSLILRSLSAGLLLVILHEASNALFTAYVAQAPLKRGQPLSAESKDPNGSLSTGFRSRKEIPKTFGLWELSYIAASPSPRRSGLYTDIERPAGSVWNQINAACSGEMLSIQTRIAAFYNPSAVVRASAPTQKPAAVETLPRIGTPVNHDNILMKPPTPSTATERVESSIGAIAKSYGQSPNPGTIKFPSSATSPSRKLFEDMLSPSKSTTGNLLIEGPSSTPSNAQPAASPSGFQGILKVNALALLSTPLGVPFRQTFARRARSVILGSPTSSLHPLISSIRILSSLLVASLAEDQHGQVSKDVRGIIQTFVSTIQVIDRFMGTGSTTAEKGSLPVHWTDVNFQQEQRQLSLQGLSPRHVPEIALLVRELKQALGEILDAFEKFAQDLGITKSDISTARKLAVTQDSEVADPKNAPNKEKKDSRSANGTTTGLPAQNSQKATSKPVERGNTRRVGAGQETIPSPQRRPEMRQMEMGIRRF